MRFSPAQDARSHGGGPGPFRLGAIGAATWFLIASLCVALFPTMYAIARFSWSTEQGGHGPLVLATGLWLVGRELKDVLPLRRSGSAALSAVLLAFFLAVYAVARITGILEIEGFALYGAMLTTAYLFLGPEVMKRLWFPLLYLGFIFPPPDSWVAAITQPIKIAISEAAVSLLHHLGYPIGSSGVTIQIAQYELLVAAACAGLNSLISLTAICLFYIYIRHNTNLAYAAALFVAIVPIAVFANFARVVVLILITYYFGDAAAQGFMHDFAGLLMFAVAMLAIIGLDSAAGPLRRRLAVTGTA